MSFCRVSRIAFAFAFAFILAVAAAWPAFAEYNPPATYYNSAVGSGATLKSQLQTIVGSMTGVNYGNAPLFCPLH